jgi:hypothetical protein
MQPSMTLTIGQALSLAHQHGSPVLVYVRGVESRGKVIMLQPHTVVLRDGALTSVIRLEAVDMVVLTEEVVDEPRPPLHLLGP